MELRRIGFVVTLALGLLVGCARAQFIGYTSAQSTTSTPYNGVTCTAALAASPALVANIGQGGHWVTATTSTATVLNYTIVGSYDAVTYFDISDVGTTPVNSTDISSVTGSGYYPVIGVKVSACAPASATITLKYSGISLPPGTPVGVSQAGQISKHIAEGAAANTTFSSALLRTPFGSTAGTITFSYAGVGSPTGSTVTVTCSPSALYTGVVIFTAALQNTVGLQQQFSVPNFSCPLTQVTYTSGGAGAASYALDYAFALPGNPPGAQQYTHVTGTTATVVKGTPGYLHTVSVNTGGAGTFSVFDLPAASCTGTPATNTIAVITAVAGTLQTFTFDVATLNGICVKASVAMDVTVSSQ